MIFLYNIFIFLFHTGIRIAAIWDDKAKQWLQGRRKIWHDLEEKIHGIDPIIWIHVSSAGEFEQAKPVIEELKLLYSSFQILVSFFSPSGYNAAKNYSFADYIFYLPVDTITNAKRFINKINPRLVIFVKYDFWYHFLHTVHSRKIPMLLISSVFRKEQSFFKWYGGFYRKMLAFFTAIFVQDKTSYELLQQLGIKQTQWSGDTRFDRVAAIANNFTEIPFIKLFIGDSKVLVAGSTWPDDESVLMEVATASPKLKLILAAHEVNDAHIKAILQKFPGALLYSQLKDDHVNFNEHVLVIDNVGMLSKLYQYATITYVGGGFTRDGIHNILEAAVFGRPVIFGPNHRKYKEAKELIDYGGGISIASAHEMTNRVKKFLEDSITYGKVCQASIQYIEDKKGATQKIMNYIQEKRLLTN